MEVFHVRLQVLAAMTMKTRRRKFWYMLTEVPEAEGSSEMLVNICLAKQNHIPEDYKGEGTPRKLATATQPQFPRIVINLS
jgi:hypothetical protein